MPPKKKGKGKGPLKSNIIRSNRYPHPLPSREEQSDDDDDDDDNDDDEDIQDVVLSNP